MGGKRSQGTPDVMYQAQGGKQIRVGGEVYNAATALGGTVNNSDISSLDRKEFLDRINSGLAGNSIDTKWVGGTGGGGAMNLGYQQRTESASGAIGGVQAELADAIAGVKPKYRYRKYLDQVSRLQNDQPGQLQTVLSRGGSGSILGGGSL